MISANQVVSQKINLDNQKVDRLLDYISEKYPMLYLAVQKNLQKNPELFYLVGNQLIDWAYNYLGDGYETVLGDSYHFFMLDVLMTQNLYEKLGHYPNKDYQASYQNIYDNSEYMLKYHWGCYLISFLWEHHLKLYQYFQDSFLRHLSSKPSGKILELGSGSGIWLLLLLNQLSNWTAWGIDISKKTVEIAQKNAQVNGFGDQVKFMVGDATRFEEQEKQEKFDGVISFDVIEHLEKPELLIKNMANNLNPGGYAFLGAALTATESGHIYEFRRESEVVLLAEKNDFRVISYWSLAPEDFPSKYRFLPRTQALFMQKRINDIW